MLVLPTRSKDERGDPTKIATHMHSKEGEVVEFVEDCSCDGPVEVWLQNVVDSMKLALQVEFRKAIPTYDELPRTKWIYVYSAQNTVVVSRTFFTQEINEAFDDLEEGKLGAGVGLRVVSLPNRSPNHSTTISSPSSTPTSLVSFFPSLLTPGSPITFPLLRR